MFCFAVKSQNVNKMMSVYASSLGSSNHGLRTSVYFWLTVLAMCQCLSGKPTAATAHRWSLAELSVTSSELPKQIPAPPYPVQQQQRIQSTPHYDQQLKLPTGHGEGPRHHYYPWTQPTVSIV